MPIVGKDAEQEELLFTAGENAKWNNTLEDWWFILSLSLVLPYDPAITYLSIYPTDWKAYVHTNTCTLIFIAVEIMITKNWKQPKMEYFPFIKKRGM